MELSLFGHATKISTKLIGVLERRASVSVEQLHIVFKLGMSTFPAENLLKKEKNRGLWN